MTAEVIVSKVAVAMVIDSDARTNAIDNDL